MKWHAPSPTLPSESILLCGLHHQAPYHLCPFLEMIYLSLYNDNLLLLNEVVYHNVTELCAVKCICYLSLIVIICYIQCFIGCILSLILSKFFIRDNIVIVNLLLVGCPRVLELFAE